MLVTNEEEYRAVWTAVARLDAGEELAIDTETTGLKPYLDTELRGISLAFLGETRYVPVSHPGSWNVPDLRPLAAALSTTKALPLLHNAKYDFAVLERAMRWSPPARYRDTQILAWLTDENRRHGLKALGSYFFGEDEAGEQKALKALMKGVTKAEAYKQLREEGLSVAEAKALSGELSAGSKRTWADLTAEEIAPYAEQDASLTLRLYRRLLLDPEMEAVAPAVQHRHDFQDVIYRMERVGVAVDEGRILTARERNARRAAEIEAQFDVNLGSAKQLARLVYEDWGLPIHERTDGGQPSTSREALEALAGSHEGLDLILEHRRLTKANATYFDALLENLDPTGRIHAWFNTVGTVTGRLSSSGPNLQTIPRDDTLPEVRAVFCAGEGYELVSFDLKQAELRFMAALAREHEMMEALEAGRNLYVETADAVICSPSCTKSAEGKCLAHYTFGKALVLSWPYGVGPRKFARNFTKGTGRLVTAADVRLAKQMIGGFEDKYPNLAQAMGNLAAYADTTGRLQHLQPGYFSRFTSPAIPYPIPGYTALNRLCQGGVAHFIGNVMGELESPLSDLGGRIVLQVHDNVVCEVPPGVAGQVHTLIQRIGDNLNPLSDMPLRWDAKSGL